MVLLEGCGERAPKGDMLLRAKVDSYNKAAFVNRYRDPLCAISEAYDALELLRDSMPLYHDGRLRAYNNLAYDYYMLAEHDSAAVYVDSVLLLSDNAARQPRAVRNNVGVERVIAQLLQVRLLQRSCRIADSYSLLYDIDRGKVLRRHKGRRNDNRVLYDFAQMEYFITSLTLNYHYRNGAVASSSGTELAASTMDKMRALLDEVEEVRPKLRCDYAEDFSLNYAMAHACYRMAAMGGDTAGFLRKAYDYIDKNQDILNTPQGYCDYHQANVYQLRAFIGADTAFAGDTAEVLRLFRVSTEMFFATPDPYQHLGAVVAAAEYCQRVGEVEEAAFYYSLALADSSWHDGIAPKFESMLYDGLIRLGYSDVPEDNSRWYAREMELLSFIQQNEEDDFALQDQLEQSEGRNRYYLTGIAVGAVFLLVLVVLVVLLRRRSKVLHAETLALQEAKRQDVERIANVETCLSVLRHDINPFLSYLQNKKLSDEMRQEVLEQLLRTFGNIKNWTNLSIPSGLQFQPSVFRIDEVFASVEETCANIHSDKVRLTFVPSGLMVNGDRQLVEILLRNLVNNALQHTEEGSVEVSAERYDEDGRFVRLTVADTGCGMDAETIDDLFRADKKVSDTADPSAPHGTGFGLILCKYIIKRHDDNTLRGCRIWAESEVGKGSRFHCLLKIENY